MHGQLTFPHSITYLQIIVTLDLKEGTLKFSHGGRSIGTIAGVKGPLHAAVTLTSSRQKVQCFTLWLVITAASGAGTSCGYPTIPSDA
jgi:hypothetical protein